MRNLKWGLLATALLTLSGQGVAALITVSGGFTAFHTDVVLESATGITSTLNGNSLCADAGCDTRGPANVSFATAVDRVAFQNGSISGLNAENAVAFTPGPAAEVSVLGQPFLLGTISFENGIWSSTTLGTTFDFSLTTHATPDPLDPTATLFDNQILSDTFQLTITPNDFVNGTPDSNADYVSSLSYPLIGNLMAYELQDSPLTGANANVVTAQLWGYLGSLHLDSFRNATGGGFVVAPSQVPEPAGWALMAAGLAVLAFMRRRHATIN